MENNFLTQFGRALIFAVALTGCSILPQGAYIGANKAYDQGDYSRAVYKVNTALHKYSSEYDRASKANLYWIKAQSLAALGESAQAVSLYQFISTAYPETEAGILSKQFSAQNVGEHIVEHHYSAPGLNVAMALNQCRSGAKQKALEYYGVTIASVNQFTQDYQANVAKQNNTESVQNQNELTWSEKIVTSSGQSLSLQTLKEQVKQDGQQLNVSCQLKARLL